MIINVYIYKNNKMKQYKYERGKFWDALCVLSDIFEMELKIFKPSRDDSQSR